jgi:hypothetical protein
MRNLILAVAAVALIGAPAYAAPTKAANAVAAANTTSPAKTKAAPKYDCTKKGNANKAACKTVAAAPAPMPMAKPAPAAAPAPVAKPAPSAMAAATPAKGGGMKACAAAWDKFSADQKAAYTAKAKGQKSKSGKALSGYNVYTGECMKK